MITYISGRFLNPILSQSNGIERGEGEYYIQKISFKNGNSLILFHYYVEDEVNCLFFAAFLYPGLIGPGIPLNQSGAGGSGREDVTLAAGFDSDFFNFFPWKLQKDGNSSGK